MKKSIHSYKKKKSDKETEETLKKQNSVSDNELESDNDPYDDIDEEEDKKLDAELQAELDKEETKEELGEMSESTLSYYMQRIAGSTPISKEEEQELGRRIAQGDKSAFEELVSANLKFVIKIAYRFKNVGLPMSDIINQGNLGLLEAAKRYDPSKDVKFISYAVWWIRQYIVQGIAEQSGTVKLPTKQATTLFRINAAKEQLDRENGYDTPVEELAEHLNMKEDMIEDILRVSKQSLSLETPVRMGEDRTFVDFLESDAEGVEETLMRKNLQSVLDELISELDSRESQIIRLRFGLDDDNVLTLDELGKIFGVSRERIRQLENRALDKLKKKATRKGLQFYLAS